MNTTSIIPEKPTITQLDANRLAFLAGAAAEQEAKARGVGEADAATLLDAASGGRVIGKMVFPPIHGAFMLMIGKVEEVAKGKPNLASEMGNMAALAFILKNPKLAWAMLRDKGAADLFEETVTEFAMMFTFEELAQITHWVTLEMDRLRDGGNNAGKSPAA